MWLKVYPVVRWCLGPAWAGSASWGTCILGCSDACGQAHRGFGHRMGKLRYLPCIGYEILESQVAEAQRVADKFELEVSFRCQDALEADISDAGAWTDRAWCEVCQLCPPPTPLPGALIFGPFGEMMVSGA